MKPINERIYDANRAREVLDNEAFQAAFSGIEQQVIEQWTNSPARDKEGREQLWVYLSLLRKVKAQLTYSMETGKLAQLEIEHQEKKKSLLERIGTPWSQH